MYKIQLITKNFDFIKSGILSAKTIDIHGVKFIKIFIIFILVMLSFSGCSTKIYSKPSIKLTAQDAKTKEPIKGLKLSFNEISITNSDSNGEIYYDGKYEKKWHAYPFPILSVGRMSDEPLTYTLSHKDYSLYNLDCHFTSLGGQCIPKFTKIDSTKKDITFDCVGCNRKSYSSFISFGKYVSMIDDIDEIISKASSKMDKIKLYDLKIKGASMDLRYENKLYVVSLTHALAEQSIESIHKGINLVETIDIAIQNHGEKLKKLTPN